MSLACTPVNVLKAAIKQLSKEDGYTPDTYYETPRGKMLDSVDVAKDPSKVGAVCAIGGVEHAIYKLCASARSIDFERETYVMAEDGEEELVGSLRERIAQQLVPNVVDEDPTSKGMKVYITVMGILNKIAHQYTNEFGRRFNTVEEMTTEREKEDVLRVFRKALAKAEEVEAEA